jgi:hypothetical protein
LTGQFRGSIRKALVCSLAVLWLVSCGKRETAPAVVPTPPQVVAAVVHKLPPVPIAKDPVAAAQQYAQQMDRTESARCGTVFDVVVEPLQKAGDVQQASRAQLFRQAAVYLAEVPMPGSNTPPPKYPEIQAAVNREAMSWSRSLLDANLGYCFSQFQTLYGLLDTAGKIDKKAVQAQKPNKGSK